MEVLASCSLERSKGVTGSLFIQDSEGKGHHKVLLNVVVDDESEEQVFSEVGNNVKCVTFAGSTKATHCPEGMQGRVFNQYTLSEIHSGLGEDIEGVVTLVKLPDDYSHMLTLKKLCETREDIRVIGGNLLSIEGVRIGRYKGKRPLVCKGIYDSFIEIDLDSPDADVREKIKKAGAVTEKSGEKKSKDRVQVEKKPNKRVVAFNTMFGGGEEDF